MQKLTFTFLLVFIVNALFAQQMFQRTYGGNNDENITALTKTDDGGYALAGFTTSFGPGSAGAMLVKTDANGDTLWAKSYGNNNDDECFTVRQTFDKGYILTGYSENISGNWDIYLIKTDSVGDTLWTKMFGGNGHEVGAYCRQLSDSGYIVVGYTNSVGTGSYDAYILRTNSMGDTLWARVIGGTGFFDYYNAVIPALGGGFIAVGGIEDFGSGSTDAFITKFDDNGDTLWSKIYGLSNFEDATSIVSTQDSMYLVSGTTNSAGSGGNEAWVMKIDLNGNVIWHNGFGGTGDDRTYHLSNSPGNGAVVAGFTRSFGAGLTDVLAFETDSLGSLVWATAFGGTGDDWANRVYPTSDSGYVFGAIGENLGQPNNDFYLIKTDSIGDSGCNQNNANVQVTTFTFTTAKITPQITFGLPILSSSFTVVNPAVVPDTLCFMCDTISTAGFLHDTTLNVVSFTDTTSNATGWMWDFGDGNTSTEQAPTHNYAVKDSAYFVCLTVFNSCDTITICDSVNIDVIEPGLKEHFLKNGVEIYPNPNSGMFSMRFNVADDGGKISLLSINGQLMLEKKVTEIRVGQQQKFNVQELSNGVYYVSYSGTKYTWIEKIIIQ